MPLSLAQDLPVVEQDSGALVPEAAVDGSALTAPTIEVEDITIPRRGGPPLVVRIMGGNHQGLVGYSFEHRDLSGCDFSRMVLAGARFFDCDLSRTLFDHTNCAGVTFDASRLRDATFRQSNLTGTSFDEARLEGARFIDCVMAHSNMRSATVDEQTAIHCERFGDFEPPRQYIYLMSRRWQSPDDMFRQEYPRPVDDSEIRAERRGAGIGTASSMTATEAAMIQERRAFGEPTGTRPIMGTAWAYGTNEEVEKKKSKPRTYRFGLEFEAFKPEGIKLEYRKSKFGTDGSIHPPEGYRGFELRTEPLKRQEMWSYLKGLLRYTYKNNCGVNSSCGLHLHASHPKFFNAEYIKKLVFFWISIEDVIMSTQPKGRFNNYYCKRTLFQYINDYGRIIPEEKEELIREMSNKDRYSALNLSALQKHGTIEIRLHEGTLDLVKVEAWVTLMKAIFDHVMNNYNPVTTRILFNQDISEEKINKVFELLKIPVDVVEFYKERIKKFGWKRLKKQTEVAKECIAIQKAKIDALKKVEQIDRKLQIRIKKLRGKEPEPSIFSGVRPARSLRDVMQEHVNQITQPTPPEGSLISNDVINQAYREVQTSLGTISSSASVPEGSMYYTSPRGIYTVGSSQNSLDILRSAGSGS